jgi:hypothetical protein
MDQVDAMFELEQFPEIINAGGDDQQAAQAIAHSMKDPDLDEKDIYQRKKRIGDKEKKKDFFGLGPVDDLAQQKEVEIDDQHRFDIVDENSVVTVPGKEIEKSFRQAIQKQEYGEIFQILFDRRSKINCQAYEEGNSRSDRNEVIE